MPYQVRIRPCSIQLNLHHIVPLADRELLTTDIALSTVMVASVMWIIWHLAKSFIARVKAFLQLRNMMMQWSEGGH